MLLEHPYLILPSLRNTLMINLATPSQRAFIIALASTLVSCGNAFGPVLLNLFNWQDNFFTFMLIAGIFLASGFVLIKIKTRRNQYYRTKQYKFL